MLVGSVGAVFLSVWSARAADMPTKAPSSIFAPNLSGPAVDGVNGKAEFFGGTLANRQLRAAAGSVTVPLAHSYGFQMDGVVGKYDHRKLNAVAAHLFWRNPNTGLIGAYGSFTSWDQLGGQIHVGNVALEAAWYWNRLTVEGVAGIEFGNSVTSQVGQTLFTTDIDTRFFDKINVAYYFLDNFKAYAGHRYLGGRHAAAFGAELAMPIPRTTNMASLFVEGRAGEYTGVWGGLKLYFGKSNKTLIQRHRQDDPPPWEPESAATMGNQTTQVGLPKPAPFV
jgi:hypothetical protein